MRRSPAASLATTPPSYRRLKMVSAYGIPTRVFMEEFGDGIMSANPSQWISSAKLIDGWNSDSWRLS
jgi:cyanate lyase